MSVRSGRCRPAPRPRAGMTICNRGRRKTVRRRSALRRRGRNGKKGVRPVRYCWIWVAVPLLVAGCSGWQSALDPHGPDARNVHGLIWLFVIVAAIVWGLVLTVLAGAIWHRRPAVGEPPVPHPGGERRAGIAVGTAT